MIAIVDYGAGNLDSVEKALQYIGCETEITEDPDKILDAQALVMPGVGAFGDAMEALRKSHLDKTILDFIDTGKPFLGICLGLQMLFEESEESPGVSGLGIFRGTIAHLPIDMGLKIPHIGWNSLDIEKDDVLFQNLGENPYMYFVHSYFLHAQDRSIVAASAQYGTTIDAAISYKNIRAMQFHPEKSGDTGIAMLRNFRSFINQSQNERS